MSLYDDLSLIASDLIGEFGQIVTISRKLQSIDPIQGQMGNAIEISSEFKVVNPPASQGVIQSFDNRVITEAANIYKSIRFLIVSAYGQTELEPTAGDKVTMQGIKYTIFGATPIAPDGTKIVYRVGMGI
ncbi:MAG: hypothetical protein KIT80_23350 [Chitinophagaceae bacterium]|nr:hypothetical protein [Nitrosomonas sp.]MCW5929876.1 hypothetical protein [Chitinophagaceae bacterium]